MSQSLQERLHKQNVDDVLKEGIHHDLIHNRLSLAEGKECPLCIKRENGQVGIMRKRTGPYGMFLSCSLYPHCKFSWNSPLDEKTPR